MPRFTLPQAERLIGFIRHRGKKGATYLELTLTCISSCPHKRLEESAERYLKKGERLIRKTGDDKLVRFFVVAA